MRFDSVVLEVAATPTYVLATLAAMLLAMHWLLIVRLRLGDIAWKRVDYVWLGAAALGLVSASASADRFLSARYLETFERPRTATAYQFLRALIADSPGVCVPRRRTEYSPPDFDQILTEQEIVCRDAAKVAAVMPKTFLEFPPLEQTGFQPFGHDAPSQQYFIRDVSRAASEYRESQGRFARLSSSAKLTGADEVMLVLSPLLLTFALALRVTKVSGEICNARFRGQK